MKMKLFKLKWVLLVAVLALGLAGYFISASVNSKTSAAYAAEKIYEGTLYVSSMGGYMVRAEVRIDPTREEPIQLAAPLERMFLMESQDINISKRYYATHDPRIDLDRMVMFWSAHVMDDRDPDRKVVRVGKVDLATGRVLADVGIRAEARNKSVIQYCGSGQTKCQYLPVMMGLETFIDIIDKGTMEHERRVFLDEIPEFKEKRYLWTHGINSPDLREFAVVTTFSDEGDKFPRGEERRQMVFILSMRHLLDGKVKVIRKGTITSNPKKSAFCRLYYTNDQRYLLLSNMDRSNILDVKTLEEVAVDMHPDGWENHDFFPTLDSKYAIQTFRVPVDNRPGQEPKKVMDGQLQLYDIVNKKKVGKPISVCMPCHRDTKALPWAKKFVTAEACGIDGVWKK